VVLKAKQEAYRMPVTRPAIKNLIVLTVEILTVKVLAMIVVQHTLAQETRARVKSLMMTAEAGAVQGMIYSAAPPRMAMSMCRFLKVLR
jgi:hypothetical protein